MNGNDNMSTEEEKTTEEDAIVETPDGERYRSLEVDKSGESGDDAE